MGAHISIITTPAAPRVSVVQAGPKGADGSSAAAHVHTQSVAADTWIINHNLGYEPVVQIISVGGVEMEANIVHMSTNQTRVYFAAAQAGRARCV